MILVAYKFPIDVFRQTFWEDLLAFYCSFRRLSLLLQILT